ncbi:MAG: PIN domain-containing protein [Actinobacteria bacterium]|nr:PIN domain-containing protein [Actinomycetota bacterium]
MARAVFDPNVLVAALISPRGAPAALYLALTRGRFHLIASPQLLDELDHVLARSKFRRYASREEARAFVDAIVSILGEAEEDPQIARDAPYGTPVRRLDEAGAAKRPRVRQTL